MLTPMSESEIEKMREAGRINALAHVAVEKSLTAGITTVELDAIAGQVISQHGCTPSFLTEYGFPANICISVNEEIGHGLPGNRVIQLGDVVKVDIGAEFGGFHSDSARTHIVGAPSKQVRNLVEATQNALAAGIQSAQPGGRLSDISHAIFSTVDSAGYQLVRNACGHGIGRKIHEDPLIPNFGPSNRGPQIRPGMVFAIEPIVTDGSRFTRRDENGWTNITADLSYSAHFEHTVLITEHGPEILTGSLVSSAGPASEQKTENFITRPLQDADRQLLLKMANEQMNPILIEAWGQMVDPGILDEADSFTFVIETEKGKTAGFYTVCEVEGSLFLKTIVIDAPYQGKGIGKQVLLELEQMAQSEGYPAIELWVQTNNHRAIAIYEKLGYAVVDHPFFNTVAMRKAFVR